MSCIVIVNLYISHKHEVKYCYVLIMYPVHKSINQILVNLTFEKVKISEQWIGLLMSWDQCVNVELLPCGVPVNATTRFLALCVTFHPCTDRTADVRGKWTCVYWSQRFIKYKILSRNMVILISDVYIYIWIYRYLYHNCVQVFDEYRINEELR